MSFYDSKFNKAINRVLNEVNHVSKDYLDSVCTSYEDMFKEYFEGEIYDGLSLEINKREDSIVLWRRDSKGSGNAVEVFKALDYVRKSREMILKQEIKDLKNKITQLEQSTTQEEKEKSDE